MLLTDSRFITEQVWLPMVRALRGQFSRLVEMNLPFSCNNTIWYDAVFFYTMSVSLQVFFSVMAGAFSVGNALPFINSVSTAVGCATSVFKIVERVPEIDPYSKKGLKPRVVDGYIEFKRLSFKYPSRPNVQV